MKEKIIELPKIIDRRGNLSVIEAGNHIPFKIARVYWIYDVPGGQKRGSHAFKKQQEVIIALSGSFDVVLDDGKKKRIYTLNRSYMGLYIPNGMWRSLENFSTNSLCLILSSEPYEESDYIRNYKEFKEYSSLESKLIPLFQPKEQIISTPQYNTVFDCTLIDFGAIKNRAGNITTTEGFGNIPFDISRVFYIYDIPSGEERGMHAHKRCHEILIAASGSFDVELDDGSNKRVVTLNRPMHGLHIPPGVWATEREYSSGAICLAITSDVYEADDYIKTYSEFKKYRSGGN